LITHGESGKSRVGVTPWAQPPRGSLPGQFEIPYGTARAADPLHHPGAALPQDLRRDGRSSLPWSRWCSANGRRRTRAATFRDPITVADVLGSRMIAYPFRLLMCCLVTDGGGALILTAAERARDFPRKPVYILGTGESVETPMVSQMADFTSFARLPRLGRPGLRRGRHRSCRCRTT